MGQDDTDRIIFIFPVWWYDMPAILRGFLDKVMLKGSAYYSDETGLHLKLSASTTLFGTIWEASMGLGDRSGRNFLTKLYRFLDNSGRWRDKTAYHMWTKAGRKCRDAVWKVWYDYVAKRRRNNELDRWPE